MFDFQVRCQSACGLEIHIQDPDIRARLEAFDRTQSAAATKVCAYYRNDMAAAAPR